MLLLACLLALFLVLLVVASVYILYLDRCVRGLEHQLHWRTVDTQVQATADPEQASGLLACTMARRCTRDSCWYSTAILR